MLTAAIGAALFALVYWSSLRDHQPALPPWVRPVLWVAMAVYSVLLLMRTGGVWLI